MVTSTPSSHTPGHRPDNRCRQHPQPLPPAIARAKGPSVHGCLERVRARARPLLRSCTRVGGGARRSPLLLGLVVLVTPLALIAVGVLAEAIAPTMPAPRTLSVDQYGDQGRVRAFPSVIPPTATPADHAWRAPEIGLTGAVFPAADNAFAYDDRYFARIPPVPALHACPGNLSFQPNESAVPDPWFAFPARSYCDASMTGGWVVLSSHLGNPTRESPYSPTAQRRRHDFEMRAALAQPYPL